MKLAFMGSPEFSVPALRALVAAGHEVAVVYAQPPKPAGRGQRETPCPVHQAALELGLPVRTPRRLKGNAEEAAFFRALGLDAAIVSAYGLILPPEILRASVRGCLNIHASLLPRWRGAAPIQAAILAGDPFTGITIMQMDEGLDTGDMLRHQATAIGPRDTAGDLHDRLAQIGAALILEELASPSEPVKQPPAPANDEEGGYARKRTREDARLDFTQPAVALERQIRANNPWPGSLALLGEIVLKFLRAEVVAAPGLTDDTRPGDILDAAMTIACGGGTALRPLEIQRPGKAAMPIAAFLRGFTLPEGARFF
ncbi:methionyl-tRNA formyltransferase [Acidocella aquatica]|uniref:Methionyl-tRNA formyltransferase n=1 Tax=Acidocella aquatica TaxID=1922313 RepID=A0ABQ6A9Y3_9PROT|nr:methionyl-tRNA formyltransferase [Acidocella aquatica]GLR67038.1 methionyl-tRNA formyltransferase [Acidocella aquatica]